MKTRQKEALIRMWQQGIQWRHVRPLMLHLAGSKNEKLVNRTPNLANRVDYFNKGGATIAFTQLEDGRWTYALAECSVKDNFDKTKGRFISAQRLKSPVHAITTDTPMNEDDFNRYLAEFVSVQTLNRQGFNVK